MKVVPGASAVVLNADFGSNGLAVDAPTATSSPRFTRTARSAGFRHPSPATSTIVAAQYEGNRFQRARRSPRSAPSGTVYFSDPDNYQSPMPSPQTKPRVYRVSPAGVVSVVDETIGEPNGVTLSLDEKTLFADGDAGLFQFAVPSCPTAARGTEGVVQRRDVHGLRRHDDGLRQSDLYVVEQGTLPSSCSADRRRTLGASPSPACSPPRTSPSGARTTSSRPVQIPATLDSDPGVFQQVALGVPGLPY